MTADTLCGYPDRDEALVAYVYDELDGAERSAFDTHLVLCARCRSELAQLSDVREQLGAWEPPTVVSGQSFIAGLGPDAWRRRPSPDEHIANGPIARQTWWRTVPAWAQVAAAVLCLGAGAGLANLNIHYDREGLSIRTGWMKTDVAGVASQAVNTKAAQDIQPVAAPWRADLAALEQQLRTEFRSNGASPSAAALTRVAQPSSSDAELIKRVRALLDESERRQNRELALRVGEVVTNLHAQRQADLRKIDQSLDYVLNNTGLAVAKQQQTLNYLVSRTSSQK